GHPTDRSAAAPGTTSARSVEAQCWAATHYSIQFNSISPVPPRVRDVDDDVVRARPLHLEIAVPRGLHLRVEAAALLREPPRLRRLEPARGLAEILDLEAEVVDAVVVGPVGAHVGVLLRL